MTLRMDARTAGWLRTESSLKCRSTPTHNSPVQRRGWGEKRSRRKVHLSTVLAQDHFFSDFLSLHLTSKTHKEPMMMLLGVGSKTSPSAFAADLMNRWSPPLTEWRTRRWRRTHQETHWQWSHMMPGSLVVKLTWLVLGEDPAARSHRVEQFTAL